MSRRKQDPAESLATFADHIGLTPSDITYLLKLQAEAVAIERKRCAHVARVEAVRLCPDEDSIQFRVGARIAEEIEAG